MPLPEPRLDDRRFQDIVNEAKSMIPRYCPEWTDHNLSDPGVTLIELFAWMTDLMLYRLNKVPEKNYIRFMDLLGIRLQGATPAHAGLTFWFSAPQANAMTIARGTEAATVRTGDQPAITFTTDEDLIVPVPTLQFCWTTADGKTFSDQTPKLDLTDEYFGVFQPRPQAGDALYLGFAENLSQSILSLSVVGRIEGIGVDPTDPPLAWEAWCGEKEWVRCEVERDETGGLNKPGSIILHMPRGMARRAFAKQPGYWLRLSLIPARTKQPTYSNSPQVTTLRAATLGGTAEASHAVIYQNEVLGRSDGSAAQTFRLENLPVLAREEGEFVDVQNDSGDYIPWQEAPDFGNSKPEDRHFTLDSTGGEIQFGPSIRQSDGTERQYGAIPPRGKMIRMRRYRSGGGVTGNVGANALTVLKSSIPYVARVTNRHRATGGLDAESLSSAKMRAPQILRTRSRAVTAEDYEYLAREASQSVARARCLQAAPTQASESAPPGTVEVLIVPSVASASGRLSTQALQPAPQLLDTVRRYLDERRLLTTNLVVDSPAYIGVAVEATVFITRHANPGRVEVEIVERLQRYVDPLTGGAERTGWPFGRDLYLSEIMTVMQTVAGVEFVENATLFQVDLRSGQAKAAGQKITLPGDALFFPYDFRVAVKVRA